MYMFGNLQSVHLRIYYESEVLLGQSQIDEAENGRIEGNILSVFNFSV